MIAVALREQIRFDLNLRLRFEFRTGAGRHRAFDNGRRNLLVRLLVVVESAVVASAEEVVAGGIGSRKRYGRVRIAAGREGDAEFRGSARSAVRGHVTGAVAGRIGEMLLLERRLLVLERSRKLR